MSGPDGPSLGREIERCRRINQTLQDEPTRENAKQLLEALDRLLEVLNQAAAESQNGTL